MALDADDRLVPDVGCRRVDGGRRGAYFAVPFALPVSWVVPSPLVMRQSIVRSPWPQLSDVGRRNLTA